MWRGIARPGGVSAVGATQSPWHPAPYRRESEGGDPSGLAPTAAPEAHSGTIVAHENLPGEGIGTLGVA